VRTLIISMLIFLTAFISIISASAQSTEENPSEEQKETATVGEAAEPNAVSTEIEEPADVNIANDPNAILARVEQFEGLEDELRHINMESREEMRQWTHRTDDKMDLVMSVQQQITTELTFLRQLAAEEEAVKTTAAIDKIMLDRQQRYQDVIEKFERERERLRREEEREREKAERDNRSRRRR
jgi:hypothetical protein